MPAALSIWSSPRRMFCGTVTPRGSTTRRCSSCTRTCVVSSTELNLSHSLTHSHTHTHTHTHQNMCGQFIRTKPLSLTHSLTHTHTHTHTHQNMCGQFNRTKPVERHARTKPLCNLAIRALFLLLSTFNRTKPVD